MAISHVQVLCTRRHPLHSGQTEALVHAEAVGRGAARTRALLLLALPWLLPLLRRLDIRLLTLALIYPCWIGGKTFVVEVFDSILDPVNEILCISLESFELAGQVLGRTIFLSCCILRFPSFFR